MNLKLNSRWVYGTLIVALALWVLHSFLEAILAGCVTAIASWPLYMRFRRRVEPRIGLDRTALAFTAVMAVFVLAPMAFAFGALLNEAHAALAALAAADRTGIAPPGWLESLPVAGPWVSERWQRELAHAGALSMWAQRADSAAWLDWANSVGQFLARHLFIILFTILVLYFLYRQGESVERDLRHMLRDAIGGQVDEYLDVATRSLRASVNSVLIVGLFDGFATAGALAISGVPNFAVWGAIVGTFALVPFLGYVVVAALAMKLLVAGTGTASALLAFVLSVIVLFCGDKVVRPLLASEGTRLRFVWVLMGCLGGFEALGLVGLVVGPVVLTLARELWEHHASARGRAAAAPRRARLEG